MKRFLTDYGFAILAAIVVILLIVMCTPIGGVIKNQVSDIISKFSHKTEKRLITQDGEIVIGLKQESDEGLFTVSVDSDSSSDKYTYEYRIKDQNNNWSNWKEVGELTTDSQQHTGEFTAFIENGNKIQVRVKDDNKDENEYFESNILKYTGSSFHIECGDLKGLHYHNDAVYTGDCKGKSYEDGMILSKLTLQSPYFESGSITYISKDFTNATSVSINYSPPVKHNRRDGYCVIDSWKQVVSGGYSYYYESLDKIPRKLGDNLTFEPIWEEGWQLYDYRFTVDSTFNNILKAYPWVEGPVSDYVAENADISKSTFKLFYDKRLDWIMNKAGEDEGFVTDMLNYATSRYESDGSCKDHMCELEIKKSVSGKTNQEGCENITISPSNGKFSDSSPVTITANPGEDCKFSYWLGTPNITDSNSATTTITFKDHSSITAYFEKTGKVTSSGGSGTGGTTCVTEDTLITMSDGSKKAIKDINKDELVMSYNLETGKFEPQAMNKLIFHGKEKYQVLKLKFEDGTFVEIIGEHGFLDRDKKDFVQINIDNYNEYIGDEFMKSDKSFTKLIDVVIYEKEVGNYSIFAANNVDFITNDMVSLSGTLSTVFALDDEMKYNQKLKQEDIDKYGLFTYEEWKDYVTEKDFNELNLSYYKVLLEKGLVDWDYIYGRLSVLYKDMVE